MLGRDDAGRGRRSRAGRCRRRRAVARPAGAGSWSPEPVRARRGYRTTWRGPLRSTGRTRRRSGGRAPRAPARAAAAGGRSSAAYVSSRRGARAGPRARRGRRGAAGAGPRRRPRAARAARRGCGRQRVRGSPRGPARRRLVEPELPPAGRLAPRPPSSGSTHGTSSGDEQVQRPAPRPGAHDQRRRRPRPSRPRSAPAPTAAPRRASCAWIPHTWRTTSATSLPRGSSRCARTRGALCPRRPWRDDTFPCHHQPHDRHGPARDGRPPGARPPPPPDALHAQRRVRAGGQAAAGARARRGGLRLRHRGQALLRRAVVAVLLADRLLARRGDGVRRVPAAGVAGLQHQLGDGAPAGHPPRRGARRARARRPQPRVLHQRRLGGGRGRLEAGPPVLRRARRGAAHEGDRAHHRLPRRHARRPLLHRRPDDEGAVRAGADRGRARLEHQRLPRRAARPPRRSSRTRSSPRARRRSR